MARPQFSLKRLMLSVTCFAVALGAFSQIGDSELEGLKPFFLPLVGLVLGMPILAMYLIAGRIGVAIALISEVALVFIDLIVSD